MNYVEISVIIPTRNRLESLIETIKIIYKSDYVPKQIVIIDQSEKVYSDKIKTELKRFNNIEITYYYQNEPSLTKARNKGIELAKYGIIICSDDDIIVEKETIKEIYKIFTENKEVALIAGIDKRSELESSKGIKRHIIDIMGYVFMKKKKSNKGYVLKSIMARYPLNIEKRTETEWAMGYFFALRKELIDNYNIEWDEKLISYAYPEDLDFSYRFYEIVRKNNMKMILDPNVKVEHCTTSEWRITSKKQTFMYVINRQYLSYKLFPNYKSSRVMTIWCNLGELIRRIIYKDNIVDLFKAQYYCFKYREDIKNGKLPYHLFE